MSNFPGGSKSRVNRAGDNVRKGVADAYDLRCIEEWRGAHRDVLNTFQASLRARTKYQDIIVAQRHKRRNTIIDKLQRIPKMELSRMDDIAGCRLIFNDLEEVYKFRQRFHGARFKHTRKNEVDKYDYIKKPKSTGYRGIHDVYSYNVTSSNSDKYKGLLIEIQYRTMVQHAWATAVEVVGFITENRPKFQQGDERYLDCMSYASEILARGEENCTGPYPDLSNIDLLQRFDELDDDLKLIQALTGLNTSESKTTKKNGNMILLFEPSGDLKVRSYRDTPSALDDLFRLENERPDLDIVLVKADSSKEIRTAFQNYFSDAKDFVRMLTQARSRLLSWPSR